ncbi:MAG: NAD-dependent epimerase/dehydratase family protein [Planctomycetes bacterium]|nr:NAD-dependent epimerase/dehydratase family protein [Planctomycetota bacterium]
MAIVIVTGSAGLIGAEAVRFFAGESYETVGIDNDMRRAFFGDDASTAWSRDALIASVPHYRHEQADIRDKERVDRLFAEFGTDIAAVIHTAAQPSHDWAAKDPHADFSVNAVGTLNLLEATRKHAPSAAFVFTSTNKVYGDNPNLLPLVELETRWEIDASHAYFAHGIDEFMSVDHTTHSLFGVSKLAADAMVQEYGRYFGMNTACFRGGCLTGPGHSGTKLHGFLSYLAKCAVTGAEYTVLGYKGKQVRDNIHASDLVRMFWHYVRNPRPGMVYNAGGGRHCNCSIIEAIGLCERITGRRMNVAWSDANRTGDHIWYISDTRRFQRDYPEWRYAYDIERTLSEILEERRKSDG